MRPGAKRYCAIIAKIEKRYMLIRCSPAQVYEQFPDFASLHAKPAPSAPESGGSGPGQRMAGVPPCMRWNRLFTWGKWEPAGSWDHVQHPPASASTINTLAFPGRWFVQRTLAPAKRVFHFYARPPRMAIKCACLLAVSPAKFHTHRLVTLPFQRNNATSVTWLRGNGY